MEIAKISEAQWARLVGPEGFYASYEWLRSVALVNDVGPTFTVFDDDQLVAAVPSWPGDTSGLFGLPDLIGQLPGPWASPFLWLGAPRSTANALICRPDSLDDRWLADLLRQARIYAQEHELVGIVWPYLSYPDARRLARSDTARVILHDADAIAHFPLEKLRQPDRKTRNREHRTFMEAGACVNWKALTRDLAAALAPVIASNRTKHGSAGGSEWMRNVFAAQFESGVYRNAIVAVSESDRGLDAAAVFYRHHDWLYGRYWGSSESAPPYAYYELTQYAPARWAAEHGFRHLHLSISQAKSKVRRGAQLRPLAMLIDSPIDSSELINSALVDKHNTEFTTHWRREFSARPAALDPSWTE
ncbi:MAG: hypothetical protein HOQ05_12500 [Corynebacteriales bacterium]|nr:hypothetical protein [Mycobacteriales bacterium]